MHDQGRAVLLARLLAAVALVTGGWTFADPGLLSGPAAMVGSVRGTALVVALAAAPAVAVASTRAARGGVVARFVFVGAAGYLVYNSVMLVFGTPFNAAFLAYVTLLGLSVATLVAALWTTDVASLPLARVSERTSRGVAVLIAVVAVGNALMWLEVVVPASLRAAEVTPVFLVQSGLTTNPVYAQDLALWLPAAGTAAWLLWHRRRWGYLLAGSVLGFWVLEGLSVASDQWFGARADASVPLIASSAAVGPFLVLAALAAGGLWAVTRHAGRVPVRSHENAMSSATS